MTKNLTAQLDTTKFHTSKNKFLKDEEEAKKYADIKPIFAMNDAGAQGEKQDTLLAKFLQLQHPVQEN